MPTTATPRSLPTGPTPKWRLLFGVLIALLVIDTAWSYFETRRLETTVAAWKSPTGRPVADTHR